MMERMGINYTGRFHAEVKQQQTNLAFDFSLQGKGAKAEMAMEAAQWKNCHSDEDNNKRKKRSKYVCRQTIVFS